MESGLSSTEIKVALTARGYSYGNDVLDEAINEGVARFLAGKRWEFLSKRLDQGVPANSTSITFSDSLARTIDGVVLRDAAGTRTTLDYLPPFAFYQQLDSTVGRPETWTHEDNAIKLYPPADKAYTAEVRYQAGVASVTGDSGAILPIPKAFRAAVIAATVLALAYRQRDWNAIQIADQQYQQAKADLTQFTGIRNRQASETVGHSDFWSDYE